jgi:hypothetical protein
VTSARKIQANRANARLSTGPKTAMGRRHSARNALRFGLSLPVLSDPKLSEEVMAVARQIGGAEAGPGGQELARRIAEAYIDLDRVRGLRHGLISRALNDPDYDSLKNLNKKVTTALRIIRRWSRFEHVTGEEVKSLSSNLAQSERFATVIAELPRRFPALDRYERRALRGSNGRLGISMRRAAPWPRQFGLKLLLRRVPIK